MAAATCRDLFLKEHLRGFQKLKDSLIAAIDEVHPIRLASTKTENDRLHGAAVFLNEAVGYEKLRSFIVTLDEPVREEKEPPSTYREEEM